eukprot:COSAG01_NODE_7975_length_2968_cov_1.410945_5_plen_458_part_00
MAKDLGAYAMSLTVKHEGGVCLWPTNHSSYSIKNSPFGQTGRDIVAEFVASCHKYGLRPGYYITPVEDGWTMQQQPNISASAFLAKEMAMFGELLSSRYGGEIERTWWDHYPYGCGMTASGGFRSSCPKAAFPSGYADAIAAVRHDAPHLLITNGPDAANALDRSIAGNGYYPVWNSCELDPKFPRSMRICKQFGPGHATWMPRQVPDSIQVKPVDWFWHKDRNGSVMKPAEIWDRWLMTVGGGSHYLLNVPPNSSGLVPEDFHTAVKLFGDGLRESVGSPVAQLANVSVPCYTPIVLQLPTAGAEELAIEGGGGRANGGAGTTSKVQLIQVREDVSIGQRIAKYAYDAQLANGTWVELKVAPRPSLPNEDSASIEYGDAASVPRQVRENLGRPCPPACPPLQQTVGHRVVDILAEPLAEEVSAVRFRCLAVANGTTADTIHLASMLVAPKPSFAMA